MFERFLPTALFRGQFKSLSDYRGKKVRGAWAERVIVFASPIATYLLLWLNNATLSDPDSLLAGVSLFAGALLAAFAQLSAWRDRLTERAIRYELTESPDRDALDETATHLLAASYMSALTAGLLIISANIASDELGNIGGPWAWLSAASGTYVFIVFMIAIPRLYKNYTAINKVRRALSGTSS